MADMDIVMMLLVPAKVLCGHMIFMTGRYPLNNRDGI